MLVKLPRGPWEGSFERSARAPEARRPCPGQPLRLPEGASDLAVACVPSGCPEGGDEDWTSRTVVSRQPGSPGPGLVTAPRVLTVLPKLSSTKTPLRGLAVQVDAQPTQPPASGAGRRRAMPQLLAEGPQAPLGRGARVSAPLARAAASRAAPSGKGQARPPGHPDPANLQFRAGQPGPSERPGPGVRGPALLPHLHLPASWALLAWWTAGWAGHGGSRLQAGPRPGLTQALFSLSPPHALPSPPHLSLS